MEAWHKNHLNCTAELAAAPSIFQEVFREYLACIIEIDGYAGNRGWYSSSHSASGALAICHPIAKQILHMSDLSNLQQALSKFAQLGEEDFQLSLPYWKLRSYKKGEMYNPQGSICRYLGFTVEGYFRAYMTDNKGEEKNIFLFLPRQVVVTYKSFIHQVPCDYNTQALTDAVAICISLSDLQALYKRSHGWERFGRLLAERAFDIANDRAESFMFKSAEERYLDLIRMQPEIIHHIPLYHISSYLGIAGPSLSRIRRRITLR